MSRLFWKNARKLRICAYLTQSASEYGNLEHWSNSKKMENSRTFTRLISKGLKTEESRQTESEYLSYEKEIWIIFSRFLLYFEFFDITRYKALVFRYSKQNINVSSYSVLHLRTWGPGKKTTNEKMLGKKLIFFAKV